MMKIDLEFHFIFDDYGIPFLCLLRFCFIWVQYHDDDLFEQKKSIRARFRNTQRSIFANPQKLELAKAQERRLSQLSQLSGQQQQQQQWSSDRGMIYSLNHHKYPRLSLPQAPISLSSSSSSSMYHHRSVRNSLGSTNIVPTAMIGSTLTYPTPMFDNSITALSSSSSTSSPMVTKIELS